ncbi:hypothetical protein [Edaphobacter flagellatus]|uniref:hypothetical protein n=1 Tax=Edaphobacter flagellatus TaxID=1933044 RepID=UPI0021B29FD5|nr:hypothetical protein [Edaphobacter flagellatus]
MPALPDPNDPRWQLSVRVLNSQLFEKSSRLRDFLKFICEMELTGRGTEINEHQIGVEVFGRSSAYNPGEDSIVRSQARQLRQRLDDYFRTVGAQEPLRIIIPKGSYVPLFEQNRDFALTQASSLAETIPDSGGERISTPLAEISRRHRVIAAILSGSLILLGVCTFLLLRHSRKQFQSPESQFWGTVFDPHRNPIIVPADSTLILVEQVTKKPVSLQRYLNREYLLDIQSSEALQLFGQADLEFFHYTSMADLSLVAKIVRVPEVKQMPEIRYARDISITDAKENNLILIGGSRANPWVELFANNMNFYVEYDWNKHKNLVINKSPQSGEAALYTENEDGATRHVYGVIDFQPSLDHQGHVLLVAGTTSPGTQAAVDFLLNNQSFSEFLGKIQRSDGTIPHFEVLLEADSLNGNVTQSNIVAYRLVS